MINPLQPAVYQLTYVDKEGYSLTYKMPRFEVHGKNYGKINEHINTFWARFLSITGSMGVMLTGSAGSGKTRVAELLANLAIDNGMCVVLVTEVKVSIELLPFIDSLHNMVIIFDEFSKNFDMRIQNKMLTMFSSIGPRRKLYVITENDRRTVSPFVRTRPGRVKYAIDYERLEDEVVEEYCTDNDVDPDVYKDILDLHSKAPKFTFDHLMAIVSEHKFTPNKTLDQLLEILNLDDLVVPTTWSPFEVTSKDGKKWTIEDYPDPVTRDVITGNRFYSYLRIREIPDDPDKSICSISLRITAMDLDRIEYDDYIFTKDGKSVRYIKNL